ncbi:MAG: MATE family efflux transporter [Spirochaetia bacterium]|nr:MATE family efflux transporter [Spirochaetia bacterium]MCI6953185.1 MATE family efflux transporter [Spirochaetia bacterium]
MNEGDKRFFLQGSLFKTIFIFSLPLIFTNLLQVLFSLTDVAVLGRFASGESMGSVGSVAILVFMCTGFLTGIGSGVNSIAAFYIGADNKKSVSDTVHTSALLCLISGILVCVFGILFSRPVLQLMGTKDVLIDGSVTYFRIYMLGMPALAFYNFGNGILSAEGDTKSPLKFLSLSGFVNVVLDLVFVIYFKMDIAGVAIASITALYISAFLIFIKLYKRNDPLAFRFKNLQLNKFILYKLIKIGIPAGLQNVIFAFANIFIQVGINSFDAAMVIANSAAANSDTLVYNTMSAFYVAGSTAIAQNYGAQNKKGILKSCFISVAYAFLIGLFLGILLLLFGKYFLAIFTSEAHIIELGMERLTIMAFSYCISAFMDAALASSRGLGETIIPTIIVVIGSCIMRILWIYTVFGFFGTVLSLYLVFPVTWIITATAEFIYFAKLYRKIAATL